MLIRFQITVVAITVLASQSGCARKEPTPQPAVSEPQAEPLVISPAGGRRADELAAAAKMRESAIVSTPVPPLAPTPRDFTPPDEKPSPFGASKKGASQSRKPVTIAAGTWVAIRIGQPLNPGTNKRGDKFRGVLDQPIWAGGRIIADKGALVQGVVTSTRPNPRGPGDVTVAVTRIDTERGPVIVNTGEYALRARAVKRGSNEQPRVPSDARAGFKLISPVSVR